MLDQAAEKEARRLAVQIRTEIVKMISRLPAGHLGGSMSIADALAVLYGGQLKHDPKNPNWEERDWVVMSKGHCGPALYAALALRGYFPMEMLETLNTPHTNLPSHCDRNRTPGIDMTTGSLGQGASTAAGVAIGLKMDGQAEQGLRHFRRRRNSGGTGLGDGNARRFQASGQSDRPCRL